MSLKEDGLNILAKLTIDENTTKNTIEYQIAKLQADENFGKIQLKLDAINKNANEENTAVVKASDTKKKKALKQQLFIIYLKINL